MSADENFSALFVDEHGRTVQSTGIFQDARAITAALGLVSSSVRSGQRQSLHFEHQGKGVSAMAFKLDAGTVVLAWSVDLDDPVFAFMSSVPFSDDVLRQILTNPYQGLTVVDREGIVRYLNTVHEKFFGHDSSEAIGRHVTEIIVNGRLHEVARTGKAEVARPQNIQGMTRIITRLPVHSQDGEVVGALGQVLYSGPEPLLAMITEVGRLRSEVDFYRREISNLRSHNSGLDEIIGESAAILKLKADIRKVARLDVPVLLVGESGTGKELVAHAIHMLSARAAKPIVLVNAAALPASLAESELFGYDAGAFTGAERKGKIGKFERADQSSIFVDEIGDMPLDLQVKLLRVLQDGKYERVGGSSSRSSNFRFISATNKNFESMIAQGQFRLDLFYRISGVTLRLPSLRERTEDIPAIALNALNRFTERNGLGDKTISVEALELLKLQPWPGNVRQLIHTVERAAIFAEGDTIQISDLEVEGQERAVPTASGAGPKAPEPASPKKRSVRAVASDLEESLIRGAMVKYSGNKKRVAEMLGISRSYLYKRLAEFEG